MRTHLCPIAILFALMSARVAAQSYVPAAENLESREWFQDARFGLFIHWGVYSVLGVHEWVMETQHIDVPTYERLGEFFNPSEFDADAWVRMAKDAGMKYVTITAKHHDGFAMYDSQHTDWDIVDRTVYGQDVLKPLAEACRREGLKLFFYYSQLDWHHPDYYPRGRTGRSSGRPDEGNWDAYIDYMNAQLAELLTNYGDVAGIWFDGWWDRPDAEWRLDETYALIHRLQPAALVGSNHHLAPKPGEDFQMFEKDLPGHNTSGFSEDAEVGTLPLEMAETMNGSWGFSLQDKNFKSSNRIIRMLVQAAGYNSNLLLNVGPMPNGKIQQEFVDTLKVVGEWTRAHGEAIYGTRGGPIDPQPWGVTTQKDDRVYVHLLDWPSRAFLLPPIDKPILSIRDFDTRSPVEFESGRFGTMIQLPERSPEAPVQILVVQVGDQSGLRQ